MIDKIKLKFVSILISFVNWFTQKTGNWTLQPERKIQDEHYYAIRDFINPFDVILSDANGHFSNLYNPSEINHAMLYLGNVEDKFRKDVVEAVGIGVRFRGLPSSLLSKDRIVICRPRFGISENAQEMIPLKSKEIVKAKAEYDFNFTLEHDEVKKETRDYYCFELVAVLFEMFTNAKMKREKVLKIHEAITSNAYMNDPENFEVIYDSNEHEKYMELLERKYS